MLMQRDKEHTRISIESVLGSITMMYIPINNHDAFKTIDITCIVSSNYGVVKDTESHSSIAHRMVTGRTQERVDIPHLAIHYCLHCIHCSTCRIQSCIK